LLTPPPLCLHLTPLQLLDNGYEYHPITKIQGADLRAHVEYHNGIEVPCAKTLAELEAAKQKAKDPVTPCKRKADGEPEGQSASKRAANAVDQTGGPVAPRHIGGLLSASAQEDDGPASKVPSPSPQAEDRSPAANGDDAEDDELASPAVEEKLPPIPTGASAPDAFGFRLVTKRKINSEVNNRIMLPAIFDFEDWEIGFRDSTNDSTRKGTKAKRGKYLNKPGSNTFHFDRSVLGYDATAYEEGDLDEELVKKHGLHPKYGVFMKLSVNNEEPPKPFVSGKKPMVFHTPEGLALQLSRSVQLDRAEQHVERLAAKSGLRNALISFCETEKIDGESIRPLPEEVEKHRNLMLEGYVNTGIPQADSTTEGVAAEGGAPVAEGLFSLLEAMTQVDAQEEARAAALSVTPRRATVSRSFDPVRDVFVGAEVPVLSPRQSIQPENPLSLFADIATAGPSQTGARHGDVVPSYQRPPPAAQAAYGQPPASQQEHRATYYDWPMQPPPLAPAMYPQLPGPPPPPPALLPPDQQGPYHEPAMLPPPPPQVATAYAEPGAIDPRLYEAAAPEQMGVPPHAAPNFLQTALNPPAHLQAKPPAAFSYPGPPRVPPPHHGTPSEMPRVPFSNPAHGTAPPGLPALRPSRSQPSLMDEGQSEPSYGPSRQMAMPNHGPYYPHNGPHFPAQEQPLHYPQHYPPTHGPPPPPPPHPMMMGPPGYQEPPHGMHPHLQGPPTRQPGPFQTGPPGRPPPGPGVHHMPPYHMSNPHAGHTPLQPGPPMDPPHTQHYGPQHQPLPPPLGPGETPTSRHR